MIVALSMHLQSTDSPMKIGYRSGMNGNGQRNGWRGISGGIRRVMIQTLEVLGSYGKAVERKRRK